MHISAMRRLVIVGEGLTFGSASCDEPNLCLVVKFCIFSYNAHREDIVVGMISGAEKKAKNGHRYNIWAR